MFSPGKIEKFDLYIRAAKTALFRVRICLGGAHSVS
jgi:hypothetical protein